MSVTEQPIDIKTQHLDRDIGVRIKALRMHLGYSQKDLSYLIGVTHQMIHKLEKGRVSLTIERLFLLCDALSTDPNHLVWGPEGRPTCGSEPSATASISTGTSP